jgi:hypothetical protein
MIIAVCGRSPDVAGNLVTCGWSAPQWLGPEDSLSFRQFTSLPLWRFTQSKSPPCIIPLHAHQRIALLASHKRFDAVGAKLDAGRVKKSRSPRLIFRGKIYYTSPAILPAHPPIRAIHQPRDPAQPPRWNRPFIPHHSDVAPSIARRRSLLLVRSGAIPAEHVPVTPRLARPIQLGRPARTARG